MSRQTPRKAKHNRNPSNRIAAISDYESDAALPPNPASYAPLPPRTNTELNLAVLRRYLPSISTILSIAANAVVYTIPHASTSWEKTGIEGTTFVCLQTPQPDDPAQAPRACVFVLNRRGLDNVIVDLSEVVHVEMTGELVILNLEDVGGQGRWLGLWIHNDQAETREANFAMVQEAWRVAREGSKGSGAGAQAGPAMEAMGRRVSFGELFAKGQGPPAGA